MSDPTRVDIEAFMKEFRELCTKHKLIPLFDNEYHEWAVSDFDAADLFKFFDPKESPVVDDTREGRLERARREEIARQLWAEGALERKKRKEEELGIPGLLP